jgi:uncharacterized membrane protein YjjB (DUF3815 family)
MESRDSGRIVVLSKAENANLMWATAFLFMSLASIAFAAVFAFKDNDWFAGMFVSGFAFAFAYVLAPDSKCARISKRK